MRWLFVLGGLAVVVVGVLIVLVVWDDGPMPLDSPAVSDSGQDNSVSPDPDTPIKRPPVRPANELLTRPNATGKKDSDRVTEGNVLSFGQEFERKWHDDKERLGKERHEQMEKLWFEGRRPRGDPESIEKLERLVHDYPDTNRAGCAAMELGHHYLRNRTIDLQARREKAAEYWHDVERRHADTLCEYNAPAAGLSKLALATWIYRQSDPGLARRLAQEIIDKHQGETDHLGRPLEVSAQRLLKSLK